MGCESEILVIIIVFQRNSLYWWYHLSAMPLVIIFKFNVAGVTIKFYLRDNQHCSVQHSWFIT